MIEVQNITKHYGPITAVNDVSFRVESGEILGFLGPNGAGKSTTMRILTGCIPATEGKAVVAGYDIFRQPIDAKIRTGYLPETPPLYPDMTVVEYLYFAARINGVKAQDRMGRIETSLKRTNLTDVRNRNCGKLSKGYKQRVGLAQTLLHNPEVLILDEPTAGLDPKQIIETRRLIKDLAGDHTVILSTHILPEVAQTCDRVVIINKGRVVAIDTPDNLTKRLRGSETIHLEIDTVSENAESVFQALDGVTNVSITESKNHTKLVDVQSDYGADVRQELARTVVSNKWGLLELSPLRMSLEDVFLELTTSEDTRSETTGKTINTEADTNTEDPNG